jgi:hypothetical protein
MCYPKTHCDPTLNPEPVCSTNGITYPNICAMRLNRNRRGQQPDLAHKGPCGMNRKIFFSLFSSLILNRKRMSTKFMRII